MVGFERQQEIMKYLREHRFASVRELSKAVFSSEASVRRDVKQLEARGLLRQIYGGVVLPEYENSVIPLDLRDHSQSAIKEKLARRAAAYLFDGATVLMDGSSTVRRILKYANGVRDLRIITNNVRLLSECNSPNIQIYCTGGRYLPQSGVLVGHGAQESVRRINADLLFFSAQALSHDGILSDSSDEETALRQVMLAHAKQKILLCDSSKLNSSRTFTVCSKDEVDLILCDQPLPWE